MVMDFSSGNVTLFHGDVLRVLRDFGAVQLFSKQFLLAVASGQVDANALLKEELASRGYDKDGNWIGCR